MMQVYVAMTRPHSEEIAAADMREAGLAAWTPQVRRWGREICGARRRVNQALLPKYVFVLTDDIGRDYAAIRSARRVVGVMGDGESPRSLGPDSGVWLAGLLACQLFGVFDDTGRKWRRTTKASLGQRVRIVAGTFKGMIGTLVAVTKKQAKVRLEDGALRPKVQVAREDVDTEAEALV